MTDEQITRPVNRGRFVKGHKMSEETVAKMKGRVPWNKGKKLPEISGVNNPFYGKHHTDEARKLCGEANKGRIPTEKQLAALELARVPGHNKGRIPATHFKEGAENPFFIGKRGQKNMSGRDWFDYKNTILSRDNHTCQKCGTTKGLEVHHIVPLRRGGDDDPSNLITVCRKCHKAMDVPMLIEDHRKVVAANV